MYLISFVCFCIVLLLYRKQKRFNFEVSINKFPGPRSYPTIGNIFWITTSKDNLFKSFRYLAKTYSTYRMWLFHFGVINIVTAEDAEDFFTTTQNIAKDEIYAGLNPWLGTGLLTNAGDSKWKKRRKLLTPAFHFSILRKFMDIISEQCEKLIEDLKHECTKSKTEVTPLVSEFMVKVICETAMGTSLQTKNEIHNSYIQAVQATCDTVMEIVQSPQSYLVTRKYSNSVKKYMKNISVLKDFVNYVIKEREHNFDYNNLQNEDFNENVTKKRLALLDLLLKEKREGNIDDEGVREEVNTFMFAGHDTTSTALCFMLMNLSFYKDVQKNIVSELHEILGGRTKITYQDVQQMQYLERCIKENLRLYPSVPVISRKMKEELKIGNRHVLAGTNVLVHIYDIHRDSKYFPNPDTFDPDRFLPENVKDRHPFSFVPFSAGPRNCIGQKFAMLELKLVISSILMYYEIEPVLKREDIQLVYNIVLKNNSPIYVKFNTRHQYH